MLHAPSGPRKMLLNAQSLPLLFHDLLRSIAQKAPSDPDFKYLSEYTSMDHWQYYDEGHFKTYFPLRDLHAEATIPSQLLLRIAPTIPSSNVAPKLDPAQPSTDQDELEIVSDMVGNLKVCVGAANGLVAKLSTGNP